MSAAVLCIACRLRRVRPAICPSCGCIGQHAGDACSGVLSAEELDRVEVTWKRDRFCQCFIPGREVTQHVYTCGCVLETIKDWAQICPPHLLQHKAKAHMAAAPGAVTPS